jgi:N-acetylmuramoyl-L-alanine amidase
MRIFLDPGHGGSDPGAAKIIKESQYTLVYALELGRALQELGFDVKYSRTSDSDVSLAERCRMANTWKADYFISIHFNAGGGTGIETFALAAGGNAEKLANLVQISLISTTRAVDRGRKFANFQVLRDTAMPAILIEGGFVDNVSDAQKIQTEDYKRKFVRGATKGICGAAGMTWKDPYSKTEEDSTMKDAVVYWTLKDFSNAEMIAAKLGNCGMFCRNANPALHPDAKAAKHLIVVGGPEVRDHPNVTNCCGLHAEDTAILAAKYAKTL